MPPETHIGEGCIEKLADVLHQRNVRRVFLVTGKRSFIESGLQRALTPLLKEATQFHFTDFTENPKLDDIIKGISHYRAFQPDLVIAAGGGSAMDVAKAINLLAEQPHDDFAAVLQGKQPEIKPCATALVAVPSTAGTGSEATHFSVVYIGHHKYSLAHSSLLPNYIFVDPQFLYSASPKITASCGLDALTQAIESLWAVSSTPESREYSLQAIHKIIPALRSAVNGDKTARGAMAEGAHLAGKAINIAKTTAAHALSYAITSFHGVPHGHAVALTLGQFFKINLDHGHAPVTDSRGANHLDAIMHQLFDSFGCKNAQDCYDTWYQLIDQLDLPSTLSAVGINSADKLAYIVENVNLERLGNHPVKLDRSYLVAALSERIK